jgi:hypothetical protein
MFGIDVVHGCFVTLGLPGKLRVSLDLVSVISPAILLVLFTRRCGEHRLGRGLYAQFRFVLFRHKLSNWRCGRLTQRNQLVQLRLKRGRYIRWGYGVVGHLIAQVLNLCLNHLYGIIDL